MDKIRVRQENQTLDMQISDAISKDFSKLPIVDRRLFEENNTPKPNSSPAHKKCWLFSVECAYEKLHYQCEPNQNTLFDHGFAVFDPV